ncbi:MAG TPA: nicotinamide-nucleotide amidohydrolase family protein [Leptospiraceae bacterium]|nr:nicotinamide-nucleotide amidohydrolase family protein [Leptospiraceae bacterium]
MPFYIFSTGTELSSGRSRDTNGPFIAQSLSEAGLDVSGIITLPDNPTSILEELSRLIARTDTSGIIITGGLGPTEDDHTVDILCKLTEKSAVEDPFALSRLEAAAKRLPGRLQLSSARRQTRVVEGCTVIKNERGLAPGMIVEIGTNGPFIAAMPGVPSEMRGMFDGTLFPYIKSRFVSHSRERLSFFIYGHGESQVQARLFGDKETQRSIPETLPDDFIWGITAQPGFSKVFFETKDKSFLGLIDQAAENIFGNAKLDATVEDKLHDYCIENKIKVALAESCTGGLISRILTDRPGASAYFQGGAVVYANAAKEQILGVSSAILETHGAVSEECAMAMAEGARRIYSADASVAITGIAGPEGGTAAKPVGTVHIAASYKDKSMHAKLFLPFDRDRIREYSARVAILHLFNLLRS